MYDSAQVYVSEQRNDGTLTISTVASEFEEQLAERTKVPAHKLAGYAHRTETQVRQEALGVDDILKRFATAVVDVMERPAHVSDFLTELDLKTISRDHNWRRIFAVIANQGAPFDGHKRILLVKYLQYLHTRKKLLDFIHAKKCGLEETSAHEMTAFPKFPASPSATGVDEDLRYHGRTGANFARLSVGETVVVDIRSHGRLDLMCASHLYRLFGHSQPCLIDQNGVTHFLKAGRNMVGRHPESDIVADPNFHDISRAHMIIDWSGEHDVRITDLSTRGTYLPVDSLDEVSRVDLSLH